MNESRRDELKALAVLFAEVGNAVSEGNLARAAAEFEKALAHVAAGHFKVDNRAVAAAALQAFGWLAAAMADGSPQADVRRCCFCGKGEPYVKRLVAGPARYICDECVTLLAETLSELGEPDAE